MHIAVPHNTTKDVARTKIEQRLGQLLAQFGGQADEMEHEWLGDQLRFKGKARGMAVEGTVEVTDSDIVIDGKLPMIARMFEGKIKQAVTREADEMFRLA